MLHFMCVCGCMCEGKKAERREASKVNLQKRGERSEKRGDMREKGDVSIFCICYVSGVHV